MLVDSTMKPMHSSVREELLGVMKNERVRIDKLRNVTSLVLLLDVLLDVFLCFLLLDLGLNELG